MSTASLIRYCGPLALLGGVLLVVGWIGQPDHVDVLFGSFALTAHIVILICTIGLYGRQHDRLGWRGQLGLVLAIAGNTLIVATISVSAYVETEVGVLFDDFGRILEDGPYGAFEPIGGFVFVTGYLLFGVDTILARMLPMLAALALILGASLLFLAETMDLSAVGISGAVVFAAGLAWLGYALWSNGRDVAGEPVLE